MNWIKRVLRYKLLEKLISVVFWGIFKPIRYFSKLGRKNSSKILVICLHRIGDTIFTFPAIRMLIEKFGERVTILCYNHTRGILRLLFEDDKLISIDKNLFVYKGWFATSGARKIVKNINPEIVIDLTGSVTSASLILFLKAKKTYGINIDYFKFLYDHYLPIRKTPHLMDRYANIVSKFLKSEISNKYYHYNVKNNGIAKILVHPFAGWKAKEWRFNNYIKLVEYLNRFYKTYLIFEKKVIQKDVIDELKNKRIPIITTDSLSELISEIKSCSVFVGNDSGPLYIASVLGKPTFSIYGPTNPLFSLPFGNDHKYIMKNLKCSPQKDQYCFTFGGVYCPTHDCTSLLPFEEVKNGLISFLLEIENNTTIK